MVRFRELIENNGIKYNTLSSKKKRKKQIPWADKYRPRKLNEIVYQHEIIRMLQEVVKTGNLPHLILHGSSGVGKTSVALSIARELFGPKLMKNRVIELNASDERGINVVRNKIVTFAKSAIGNGDPKYPSPPFQMIILDEADAMTIEAQSALRKTIEKYSKITRFCFICNYINQIIEPIASRCVKFRFKPICGKYMIKRLNFIAQNENIAINNTVIKTISNIVDGDMRKAIMLLQNLKYMEKFKKKITVSDIYDMVGYMPIKILNKIQQICIFDKNTDFKKIIKLTQYIKLNGYPIHNIIKQIQHIIKNNDDLTDNMKSLICMHFATTEKRLIDKGNEYLQLLSVMMCIRSVVTGASTIYSSV